MYASEIAMHTRFLDGSDCWVGAKCSEAMKSGARRGKKLLDLACLNLFKEWSRFS